MKKNKFTYCINNAGLSGKTSDIKIQFGKIFLIKNETEKSYMFDGFPDDVHYFKYRFIELNERQAKSKFIKLLEHK